MKTIGLLGGMSWESTELYYRQINEETKRTLGGLHSAPIAMVSVNFQELAELQHRGDWAAAGAILAKKARQVEAAGADLLLLCTNTMHIVMSNAAQSIVDHQRAECVSSPEIRAAHRSRQGVRALPVDAMWETTTQIRNLRCRHPLSVCVRKTQNADHS